MNLATRKKNMTRKSCSVEAGDLHRRSAKLGTYVRMYVRTYIGRYVCGRVQRDETLQGRAAPPSHRSHACGRPVDRTGIYVIGRVVRSKCRRDHPVVQSRPEPAATSTSSSTSRTLGTGLWSLDLGRLWSLDFGHWSLVRACASFEECVEVWRFGTA